MAVAHRPSPDWASHMPVLIKALEVFEGPVIEFGMGIFSTPLLHALCRDRQLYSYETDPKYVDQLKRFGSDSHKIIQVYTWDNIHIPEASVVFVDQKPAEARAPMVARLVDRDYVIIHDSNDPTYDYDSIYPLFKYRYDHKYLQHTTVLSNKHDVNIIYSPLDK